MKQRLNSMQSTKTHILTCPNRTGEGLSIRSLLIIWWIILSNEKGKAIIFAYWSAWETVCTSSSLNVEKMIRIFTFLLKSTQMRLLSVKRLKKTLTKKDKHTMTVLLLWKSTFPDNRLDRNRWVCMSLSTAIRHNLWITKIYSSCTDDSCVLKL